MKINPSRSFIILVVAFLSVGLGTMKLCCLFVCNKLLLLNLVKSKWTGLLMAYEFRPKYARYLVTLYLYCVVVYYFKYNVRDTYVLNITKGVVISDVSFFSSKVFV